MSIEWHSPQKLPSQSYVCGYCDNDISSENGYVGNYLDYYAYVYICHVCTKPTFIYRRDGDQTPGSSFGYNVKDITDNTVKSLYAEARDCFKTNSYTASVLCCRKLLMNIAVAKGDVEGKRFIEYVEFLSAKNFIPPDAKEWVDHIRDKGNEANHEIKIMEKTDAEDLLKFVGMLLTIVYEFPATVRKKVE